MGNLYSSVGKNVEVEVERLDDLVIREGRECQEGGACCADPGASLERSITSSEEEIVFVSSLSPVDPVAETGPKGSWNCNCKECKENF